MDKLLWDMGLVFCPRPIRHTAPGSNTLYSQHPIQPQVVIRTTKHVIKGIFFFIPHMVWDKISNKNTKNKKNT